MTKRNKEKTPLGPSFPRGGPISGLPSKESLLVLWYPEMGGVPPGTSPEIVEFRMARRDTWSRVNETRSVGQKNEFESKERRNEARFFSVRSRPDDLSNVGMSRSCQARFVASDTPHM